jgi:hypothetical protein
VRQHCAIIAHFSRFPHRNRILARANTPEEREFLQQPGAMFSSESELRRVTTAYGADPAVTA